jgi:hypothetical protein
MCWSLLERVGEGQACFLGLLVVTSVVVVGLIA